MDFSSTVIAALIGAVIPAFVLRFQYHDLYAKTVSENRMDWINIWRESLSVFLANAEILHQSCNSNSRTLSNTDKWIEVVRDFIKAREMVVLRLNMTETTHVLMYTAIHELDYTATDAVFQEQVIRVEEIAREILKPEWERVKKEAKGRKHDV